MSKLEININDPLVTAKIVEEPDTALRDYVATYQAEIDRGRTEIDALQANLGLMSLGFAIALTGLKQILMEQVENSLGRELNIQMQLAFTEAQLESLKRSRKGLEDELQRVYFSQRFPNG